MQLLSLSLNAMWHKKGRNNYLSFLWKLQNLGSFGGLSMLQEELHVPFKWILAE